ncbi:hypothetical protein [Sinorhizobium sp. CCBAU 05631]|uniref:hypothetical protein n=1 Tax=Sinorhizobium sp. CCBAU 05631 TaxID=794846 RepID=UPI001872676C|nr:hypothetical protein [Sinorhizobium sp. CCBAU 05631]
MLVASAAAKGLRSSAAQSLEHRQDFVSSWAIARQLFARHRAILSSKREYLRSVIELANKVARKERDRAVPDAIRADDDAQALFGLLEGRLSGHGGTIISADEGADIALAVIDIIRSHLIVGIWSNEVAQNNLRNAIDDYFFDILRVTMQIELPIEQLDDLEQRIL